MGIWTRKKNVKKYENLGIDISLRSDIINSVADIAQSAEHILGKDEVISSNLIISSTQKRLASASRFLF